MLSSKFPKVPKKKRSRKTSSVGGGTSERVPMRDLRQSYPGPTTPVFTLTDEMRNPVYTKVIRTENYSMNSETKKFKTTSTFRTVQVNAPPTAQTGSHTAANICDNNFEAGAPPEHTYPQPSVTITGSRTTTLEMPNAPCKKGK